MDSEKICPFCRNRVESSTRLGATDILHCLLCGKFRIPRTFWLGLQNETEPPPDAHLISGYIRERTDNFCHLSAEDPGYVNIRLPDDLDQIVRQAPEGVHDKAHKILLAVERRTDYFGEAVLFNRSRDFPLGYAKNDKEFCNLLQFLVESGLLSGHSEKISTPTLTAAGFEAIERRKRANSESEKAFVAMWFSDELQSVYSTSIAKGIEDAGYQPVRIDEVDFNGDIVDRILAEIREARFVVADFTGHRHGVYLEVGFALGLSLPVILLCHEDEIGDAHFDTEHFNHITWNDVDDDLRTKLANRIVATIGRGPATQAQ